MIQPLSPLEWGSWASICFVANSFIGGREVVSFDMHMYVHMPWIALEWTMGWAYLYMIQLTASKPNPLPVEPHDSIPGLLGCLVDTVSRPLVACGGYPSVVDDSIFIECIRLFHFVKALFTGFSFRLPFVSPCHESKQKKYKGGYECWGCQRNGKSGAPVGEGRPTYPVFQTL